jgi:hypothetical protein
MRNFFQNFAGIFADAPNPWQAAVSGYLATGGLVFDRPGFREFLIKSNNYEILNPKVRPTPDRLLPIEFFKDPELLPLYCAIHPDIVRTFRSSGTTQQTQSTSPFSTRGLALYRATALQGFYEALRRAMPPELNPYSVPGFSLIPDSRAWPTSSLAQMISWFAEESAVTFLNDEDPAACAASLCRSTQPVWVFGTAFHFVNLLDNGFRCPLPPGSVVIETGGTKGRSRSVTRQELFALIADGFSIPQRQILSEYSMSELATQSWDFGQADPDARRYQFPAWVETYALTREGTLATEGTGALVIADPLRCDLPWPVRTEDIVRIAPEGFQILRRSNAAPLKGCSLLAERALPQTAAARESAPPVHTRAESAPADRAATVLRITTDLLHDDKVGEAFAKEFGSELLARLAMEDLGKSLAQTPKELAAAAKQSGGDARHPWTIIAPGNHSLAAVHPVIMAFVIGMDIGVRIPERLSGEDSFLHQLIFRLNQDRPGFAHILPAGTHITRKSDIWNNSNILVYGSDETIAGLSAVAPGQVSGFGDTIAVSVGTLEDIRAFGAKIVRDFFSLRQSGCMSSRIFILDARSEDEGKTAGSILAGHAAAYAEAITVDDASSLHGEETRYRCLMPDVSMAAARPLVVSTALQQNADIGRTVAQRGFVLPVVALQSRNSEAFVNNLKSLIFAELNAGLVLCAPSGVYREILAESTKSAGRFLSFRSFGMAQAPAFSGLHEGRPLFSISC